MNTEKIWMDGKIVNWDECKFHALSYSLHYGVSAFEGMRFYDTVNGVAIFRLKDHIKRLLNSAHLFGMKSKYSQKELEEATKKIVKESKLRSGYIRPIMLYGTTKLSVHAEDNEVNTVIAVLPWGKYLKQESLKVMCSSYMRHHPKSLPMNAKIAGYYVNSVLAVREAKEHGFDEALTLDYEGNIAEGAAENFFMVKSGKLQTPPLGTILPGITRDSVIKIAGDHGIKVDEKKISYQEAVKADEVFLTGTAAEITPVKQIDKNLIGNGKIGKVTEKLSKLFQGVVSGKDSRYGKWMDYV